jgi:hypothetical protein
MNKIFKEFIIMRELDIDRPIYKNRGYEDRDDYLKNLADEYGVDPMVVNEIAGMLGPNEDFDGLVSELEDLEYMGLLEDFRKQNEDKNN